MTGDGESQSSSRPDGSRTAWKLLWNSGAPPKVNIFAWKAARDALATRENKRRRHLELENTCEICGLEAETTQHALTRCPPARDLWDAMRRVWDLPSDEVMHRDEPDWLLLVLQDLDDTRRMLLLMLLWRVWYVRNELTHEKPFIPIEASRRFLCSYVETLLLIKHYPNEDLTKGKQPACLAGQKKPSKRE